MCKSAFLATRHDRKLSSGLQELPVKNVPLEREPQNFWVLNSSELAEKKVADSSLDLKKETLLIRGAHCAGCGSHSNLPKKESVQWLSS